MESISRKKRIANNFAKANIIFGWLWYMIPIGCKFTYKTYVRIANSLGAYNYREFAVRYQDPVWKPGTNITSLMTIGVVIYVWNLMRRAVENKNLKAATKVFDKWNYILKFLNIVIWVYSFKGFYVKKWYTLVVDWSWVVLFGVGIYYLDQYFKSIRGPKSNFYKVQAEKLLDNISDSDKNSDTDEAIVVGVEDGGDGDAQNYGAHNYPVDVEMVTIEASA